jgi:hypothetical protein
MRFSARGFDVATRLIDRDEDVVGIVPAEGSADVEGNRE